MQRMGGGSRRNMTRKTKKGGGNDPTCGCDMQAGWPKSLVENIPLPTQQGGSSCGIPPIPNYYQAGGSCGCGLLQTGGSSGLLGATAYNSNPVPDACPFPGTGYCQFYARGGANYGEPMSLQARLRGGSCGCGLRRGGYRPTKKNLAALKKWKKGQSIGFTMTSSLKAKGLIPRTSRKYKGKKIVSAKYK